jgi:hypothetical protein
MEAIAMDHPNWHTKYQYGIYSIILNVWKMDIGCNWKRVDVQKDTQFKSADSKTSEPFRIEHYVVNKVTQSSVFSSMFLRMCFFV